MALEIDGPLLARSHVAADRATLDEPRANSVPAHEGHAGGVSSPSPLGLTAADAATLLGVSESHFYSLHKTGRLGPLPVRMGRAVRWPRQELVEWFHAGSPPRSRWQAMRRGNRR